MQPTRTNGRILGLLFLGAAIAGGMGTSLRGLSGAHTDTNSFLIDLVVNASQMKWAIGLDLLGSAFAVGIALFLFPLIKKYSPRMAITYFCIAVTTFIIVAVSNVFHAGLLTVGIEYAATNGTDTEHYSTLAKMGYDAYYWLHFLMLVLYSIGGGVLFFFFLKTRMVPKWLAVWGLLANSIVFMGGALQLFDIPVSFYLFVQNGVFVLTFIVYLLIKGFRA
jgi:hypothetical protein